MLTRQTSIDCYNKIKANGLLSKSRFEVYSALVKIGKPSTTREVYSTMNVAKQEATRFTELRKLGVIYEVRNRNCTVTGNSAIEWDLTDNLPKNIKLSKNAKQDRKESSLNCLRDLYKKVNTKSFDEDWVKLADLIKKI